MNRHVSRSNWKLLLRTAVVGVFACLLSLALAAPVFAADGTAPKIDRPPHPRPAGVTVPTPNGSVGGGGGTGEKTVAKTAILYCNSRLYVAWTGTDTAHHLYIGWGSTGGSFGTNRHQINDTIGGISGPALACYDPDGTGAKLFVAFRGSDTNHSIYVGYYDPSVSATSLQHHTNTGQQTSYSPALVTNTREGVLYLGWAGTTSSHTLNVLRSYYGNDWNPNYKYTFGSSTSGGGVALSMFSGGSAGNQMYVAWVGSDIRHYLQIGYFDGTTTLKNVPGPLGIGGLDNSFWTNAGYDASLAVVGTTLYYPYAGGYDDLNVAHSTNAQNWSDDTFQTIGASEGVGGTSYGGKLWMAWSNYDEVVRLGTYTP